MAGPLIVGGVILTVLLLIALLIRAVYRWNVRRIGELQALATANGWTYAPRSGEDLPSRWPGAPFDLGERRGVSHVVHAEVAGREVVAFQYDWIERSFQENHYRGTSVVAIRLRRPVPPVVVVPKHAARPAKPPAPKTKTGNDAFDHAFVCYAADPGFLTAILGNGAGEVLLRERRLSVRTQGEALLGWAQDTLTAERLQRLLAVMPEVAALVDGG